MEASDIVPETKRPLSTISVESFKSQASHSPQVYKDGDLITRDNWVPWLVRGFFISRGDPAVQYGYQRWSSANTGLDFESTFENYREAGLIDCLSREEKEFFTKAFEGVKIHKGFESDYTTDDLVADTAYHGTVGNSDEWDEIILKDFPSLDAFDGISKDEFMKWANERYQITLTRRRENTSQVHDDRK